MQKKKSWSFGRDPSRDIGRTIFSSRYSESASKVVPVCQFSANSDKLQISSQSSSENCIKKSTSYEKAENWHTGTTFDADSEYRLEKIVRPISRELWAIFSFLTRMGHLWPTRPAQG